MTNRTIPCPECGGCGYFCGSMVECPRCKTARTIPDRRTPTAAGAGPVYEAVTDWISDLAMRDDGAIFWKSTPDCRPCILTYGDLRELLRVTGIAEGVVENEDIIREEEGRD